jgi:hypothetical protein
MAKIAESTPAAPSTWQSAWRAYSQFIAGLIYAGSGARRCIGKFRTHFRIGHISERFSIGPDGHRRSGPALRAWAASMRAAEVAMHEVEFRRGWRERSGRTEPSKRELLASKRAEDASRRAETFIKGHAR